jgi:transcription antitermination protein NusB
MSNRHLSRTIALQTLFEWDFHHRSKKLFDLLERNQAEFAPEFDDQGFTEKLVKGVTKHLPEIDETIQKFAPDWPIDQITIVDRNILRLSVFELKFDQEMPPRVAINEAIELAKAFGGDSSYKFVNGVLGAIYKDLGPETQPEVQEPQEISAGGVVYRKTTDGYVFALIKDAIDKWTFPKGKIGDNIVGEEIPATIKREIQEEIGLSNVELQDELGYIDIRVNPPNEPSYPKRVFYYLVETSDETLQAENSVTVKDAKWFSAEEALEALDYANAKDIFNKALDILNKNQGQTN